MAKYIKKPIEVDAFQYDGDFKNRSGNYYAPEWAVEKFQDGTMHFKDAGELYIKALEGHRRVMVGDYIIKGTTGEIYPCKPDIFHKTYEEATE